MLKVILVPLDGSALAERAVPYAMALARATGSQLILLHVRSAYDSTGQPSFDLDAVAERVRAAGITAEPIAYGLYVGEAGDVIGQAARAQGADLIVMSTHGRGGPARWLYGSVADQVVRQATVPVLLIPAVTDRGWPDHGGLRALVPLDGSTLAAAALDPASELAGAAGSELILLRVVEQLEEAFGDTVRYSVVRPGPEGYTSSQGTLEPEPAPELAAAERDLDDVANRLRRAGKTVRVHVAYGDPVGTIEQVAREQGADVIAMATHGRGGLARLVLGSVAAKTLERARLPLLLVRPAAMRQPMPEPADEAPVQESSATPAEQPRRPD